MSNVKTTGPLEMILFTPVIKRIIKWKLFSKISPNMVTAINLILVGLVSTLILQGKIILAFGIYIIYPFFDLLDGAVAREYKKGSFFGKFFDSFSDIVGETIVLSALLFTFQGKEFILTATLLLFIIIAKITSVLSGLIRVQAQITNKKSQKGITSTERYYSYINFKFIKDKKISFLSKIKKLIFKLGILCTRNDTRKIIAFILLLLGFKLLIIPFYTIIFLGVFITSINALIQIDKHVRN